MEQSIWKRLMWLIILWGGSVLALAAVGSFFRLLMTAAGFKSDFPPGNNRVALRFPVLTNPNVD